MARTALAVAPASHCAGGHWRSLKSADFALALGAPVLAKSPHFALHHAAVCPGSSLRRLGRPIVPELSTDRAPIGSPYVDNIPPAGVWWLGLAVPKRHARRSVTRNLLKRQMRTQADSQRARLPPGQWVIRLRAPFDPRHFPGAASSQLRAAARLELERVFASVVAA